MWYAPRVRLDFPPVVLRSRDPDEHSALRSANGADLDGEHAARVIVRVFLAFVAVLVAVFLAGCSQLAALGEGARTARDVAKTACAVIAGTDGSPAEVTAALAAALRDIVAQQAIAAARDEAHRAEVAALRRVIEASFAATREASERIGTLAGAAPVVVPPCPTLTPIAPGGGS